MIFSKAFLVVTGGVDDYDDLIDLIEDYRIQHRKNERIQDVGV